MIHFRLLTAACVLLLANNLAQAANVDFNKIYNNATQNCHDNKDSKEDTNSSNVAIDENNKQKQCDKLQTDKEHVEPRFSTKRPRGQ